MGENPSSVSAGLSCLIKRMHAFMGILSIRNLMAYTQPPVLSVLRSGRQEGSTYPWKLCRMNNIGGNVSSRETLYGDVKLEG